MDDDICMICYDEMKMRKYELTCKHSFCSRCLLKWDKSTCPLCIKSFEKVEILKYFGIPENMILLHEIPNLIMIHEEISSLNNNSWVINRELTRISTKFDLILGIIIGKEDLIIIRSKNLLFFFLSVFFFGMMLSWLTLKTLPVIMDIIKGLINFFEDPLYYISTFDVVHTIIKYWLCFFDYIRMQFISIAFY